MKELQKILEKVSSGALLLDEAKNELSKAETDSDIDQRLRENLIRQFNEILIPCVVLMDTLHEVIEIKEEATDKETLVEQLSEEQSRNFN